MAAMQPRGGGASARRPSGGGGVVRPVYEDFKPMSEWKQDDDSHILSIDLPGFMKEQIKVSTRGHNMIVVRGERLVAGNKWNRFREEFQVPGEMNSLQVDYQGGTLYIKIPKVEKSDSIQGQLLSPPKDQTKVPPEVNAQEATNQKGLYDEENYDALQEQQDEGKDAKETMEKEANYQGSHWIESGDKTMFEEDRTPDILDNIQEQFPRPGRDQTYVSPNTQEAINEKSLFEKENYDALQDQPDKDRDAKETMEKELNYEESHWIEAGDRTMFNQDRTSDILENIINNEEIYVSKTKGKKYKMAMEENGELINERKLKMNIKVAMLIIVAIIAYAKYKFASLGEDYRS